MDVDRSVVGVVGLGIMGSAMSHNLLRAGYRVLGYDVRAARRTRHRAAGGKAASSCQEVGRRAAIVICSLPSSEALLQVVGELAASAGRLRVVIETSTLALAAKEEARRRLAAHKIVLLDCPLSGTGRQARVKDVVVYASGDRAAYRRVAPVLDGFARARHYLGRFGTGSKVKFIANLLVAIHNVAAAEALVLAKKARLDPAMVLRVVADGSGSSRMLQVRGPMMVKGDYSKAMMKLAVWEKDLAIIAAFARAARCPTPLFSTTLPLYAAAARRRGDDDTAAVCRVLERKKM